MKLIHKIVIAASMVLTVGIAAYAADQSAAKNTDGTKATINFVGVPVDKVLDTYKASAKCELIIASNVRLANHSITLHAVAIPPEDVRQMIEQALLKQAGIVITRLDDNRVSVTYNDKLKLEP